jgi:hypothetical protein
MHERAAHLQGGGDAVEAFAEVTIGRDFGGEGFAKEAMTVDRMIDVAEPIETHLSQTVFHGIADDERPTDDGRSRDDT